MHISPSLLLKLNDISSGFLYLRCPSHHLRGPIGMTALQFQSGVCSEFVVEAFYV